MKSFSLALENVAVFYHSQTWIWLTLFLDKTFIFWPPSGINRGSSPEISISSGKVKLEDDKIQNDVRMLTFFVICVVKENIFCSPLVYFCAFFLLKNFAQLFLLDQLMLSGDLFEYY